MVKNGSIFRERLESRKLRFRFSLPNLKNQSQIAVNHRITSNQRSFSDSYILTFFKKKVLRDIWNDWKTGVSLYLYSKGNTELFWNTGDYGRWRSIATGISTVNRQWKREVITPLCRCDNLDEPLKRRGNHLIGVADLCKAIRIHRNQRSRLVRLRRTDS